MAKCTRAFVDFLKKTYPDDWEHILSKYENDPDVIKDSLNACKAAGIKSIYEETFDEVNNPKHYAEQAVKIEPIDVLRFAPFDLGCALKYMIRAGHKGDALTDLKKAEVYLEWADEMYRIGDINRYEEFFTRYGFMLQKFNGIPKELKDNFGRNRIGVLLNDVRTRIMEIEK